MTNLRLRSATILALIALLFSGAGVISAETSSSRGGTIITVTTTLDYAEVDAMSGREDSYTCTYTQGGGAIIKAAPNNAGGDNCTLRRAILEAGVRPDGDRPITINFNIPASDPNHDNMLNIWEVQIDESYIWELDGQFLGDDGGQVTIDGDTQPNGRVNGPKIMINTNRDNIPIFGRSLEVRSSNNVIRNLGFHGGGQIILYDGDNLVENVWMGLTNDGTEMKLASTATTQAMRSMARGGIIMPVPASDNNIVRNNRIIGAFERAIRVTSVNASNNVIENNYIGMNASGAVPITGSSIDCTRDSDYDASLWYGGRGIQVLGNNTSIKNNTIAGLHATQTANETPPISMEIYGTANTVMGNTIGKDTTGANIGVCGQGLLFGGTESIATENTFYFSRNGFDPSDVGKELDSTIITQSFTGRGNGDPARWLKVWNNVIDGGNNPEANYHGYRFASPGVNIEMRKHIPAKITSISGTSVSGTNGDKIFAIDPDTSCGGCTVFIYRDDADDRIESFELIGTGTFNGAGTSWTGTLNRALTAGEMLRTQNMSNDDSTMIADSAPPIEYYDAQTTSRLSDVLYPVSTATAILQSSQPTATSGQPIVIVFALLLVAGSAAAFWPKRNPIA